ncbi:Protein LEO1-like protein [Bienertia sinuspersici]
MKKRSIPFEPSPCLAHFYFPSHSSPPSRISLSLPRPLLLLKNQIVKMNMIRVSNIMGIDQQPFDPKTFEEEDVIVTDESGTNKRIRLENNIVRWRTVKKADGTIAVSGTLSPTHYTTWLHSLHTLLYDIYPPFLLPRDFYLQQILGVVNFMQLVEILEFFFAFNH